MTDYTVYADLEIRILEKQDAKGYPVEITLNGEQEFERGFLQLENQPEPGCLPWLPTSSPTQDGERLFNWLLADEKLKETWTQIRRQQPHRRLRLRLDATAPELHAISWELLRDTREDSPPQDLAAGSATPFSRYLAGSWLPGSPIPKHRINKILIAIANPYNMPQHSQLA